jgi:DnaJ-class molecular chaperone
MVRHDWSIEAVRTCTTCEGTGKTTPLPAGPGQTPCSLCKGTGEERKRLTFVDLAAELRTL